MGALHAGHQALIREARRLADEVAVSIFVNPTQFDRADDLAKYTRDLEGDLVRCGEAGAQVVFAPPVEEMYPPGELTRVAVSSLTEHLCGATRPGHFQGVTTIVAKLFAIAGPCVAVFGKKDYQQLQVLRRMTQDLLLPVTIHAHPIVREADGLALSSRNVRLSPEERRAALALSRGLSGAHARFTAGERNVAKLRSVALAPLEGSSLRLDYLVLAAPEALVPLNGEASAPDRAVLAVAAFAGGTRLIDNVVLGEDPDPLGGHP